MTALIAVILALFSPRADAEALARTAPSDLSIGAAVLHLGAARAAALETGTDPELVLSISWHESRYVSNAVGVEPGGRVSCGVLTPEPVARCGRVGLVDQYVAGARHLRVWMDATPSLHAALLGFAGGYRLIAMCQRGPVIIRPGVDACLTPEVFMWRAAWIRRELARGPNS